ncbi:MAG: SCO family protein, partial [Planctomycetota bacterium]
MNRRTVQYLGITSGAALVTAGTVLALSWSSRAVSTSPGGLPEPTGPGSARPSPGPGRGSVSDFRLAGFTFTSHRGEDAGPSLFDDEVTALVFFFTSCRGPCPRLMGTMAGIERRTAGEAPAGRLRFAAISVDGTRDTPEVLTSYAARLGLDTDRWSLLTGDPALVARLASESLDYDIRTQNDVTI